MWQLYAPGGIGILVKFVYLDTEINEDFVHIGTELEAFNINHWFNMSGHIRGVCKNFTSNSIAIIFTSNGAENSFGFKIECYAVYNVTEGKGIIIFTCCEMDSPTENSNWLRCNDEYYFSLYCIPKPLQ